MTVVIYIIVGLSALAYVLAPLRGQRYVWTTSEMPQIQEFGRLDREKRMNLKALKDIEFEMASGKINEGDYKDLENHYRSEISRVLEEMDDLERKLSSGANVEPGFSDSSDDVRGEDDGAN